MRLNQITIKITPLKWDLIPKYSQSALKYTTVIWWLFITIIIERDE